MEIINKFRDCLNDNVEIKIIGQHSYSQGWHSFRKSWRSPSWKQITTEFEMIDDNLACQYRNGAFWLTLYLQDSDTKGSNDCLVKFNDDLNGKQLLLLSFFRLSRIFNTSENSLLFFRLPNHGSVREAANYLFNCLISISITGILHG